MIQKLIEEYIDAIDDEKDYYFTKGMIEMARITDDINEPIKNTLTSMLFRKYMQIHENTN